MTNQNPPYSFDRGKIFYPIMMGYFLSILGYVDIVIQGAFQISRRDMLLQLLNIKAVEDISSSQIELLLKIVEQGNLSSKGLSSTVDINYDFYTQELVQNHDYLVHHIITPFMGNTFIIAYELCKTRGYVDRTDIWEFLRHVRNAAAHGGKFNFQNGEPKRSAKWRNLSITSELQGTPLLMQADGSGGFIGPGDLIVLLWDLEQYNPNMLA